MVLTLLTGVATDRGPVRDLNEDAYHAGPRLLVVADGIGGLPAGEVASAVAVRALAPLESARRPGAGDLRKAVDAASKSIREAVDADRSLAGMGTTLTAVLFTGSGGEAVLAHIGDSRAYLLRDRHLTRVTRDDTYVQLLIDEGVITEDEARRHAQRSLVTRALHGKPERPTITKLPVRQGDRFLLCSDGLSDVVDDDAIGQALREHADPRHCAEQLVKLALKAGGPDNVTAVIGDVAAA
jgi:protein phosphatase